MSLYFEPQAEELMQFLLKQAKNNANNDRKIDLDNRKDLYEDDGEELIKYEIRKNFSLETYDRIRLMIDESCNVLKRIINEISIVYKQSPIRTLDIESAQPVYDDLIERTQLNTIMQSVNAYTNLMNHCGVLILPSDQGVQYSILTPELVDVYQDPYRPDNILALAYQVAMPITVGSTENRFVYWDVFGNHKTFNGDGVELKFDDNPEGVNPFKDPNDQKRTIIPVAWFHRKRPEFAFWDQTSGRDLYTGSLQIAVLLTYLNYMFKITSFPQKYIIGKVDAIAKQILDPLEILELTSMSAEQPQVGSLSNDFKLKEYWDVVNEKIGLIANNYGLSISNFKWTAQRSSGYALLLENWGKVEQVQRQIPVFRVGEQELFEKTKIIQNTIEGQPQIPQETQLSIDFAEVEFKEDPNLENQKWQTWIQNGIASPIDWIMDINPDLTEDEARELFEKNLEDKQQLQQRYGGILNIGQIAKQTLAGSGNAERQGESKSE